MLNRSAVVIGHAPPFFGWLKTTGLDDAQIAERAETAERVVYLIPAVAFPEEAEEVVEDLFEEIFIRELSLWQPIASHWPDTADFHLFTLWFTVDTVQLVEDIGRDAIVAETA